MNYGNLLQGGGGGLQGSGGGGIQVAGSSPQQAVGVSSYQPAANIYGVEAAPEQQSISVGGGSGGYSAPVDPYAGSPFGSTQNYQNTLNERNLQKGNIFSSALDAAGSAGLGIKNSILDYVDSLRSGQNKINEAGIQNEMAKKQGTAGVLDMVGRGIKSGGVMLANKNAGDSSAAGALANAYGEMGRKQLSNVGNQYELQNRNIGLQQTDLDTQRAAGARKIGDSKTQVINNIVLDARNQLAALDTAGLNASLPERIQIEQEKQNIKDQVSGQLQQYDQMLAEQSAGVKSTSTEQRRGEAARLAALGQAPTGSFQYTSEAPAQWAGTGPFASELPIYTYGRGKSQNIG